MSSEFDDLIEDKAVESHGMTVQPEVAAALDEILDAGPLAADDPGPLSDEEHQAMEEMVSSPIVEAAMAIADLPEGTPLVLLKPDQVPLVGTHYVIWDSRPHPVLVGSYAVSEVDHLRSVEGLGSSELREERSESYARWRYRGYLAGQVSGL